MSLERYKDQLNYIDTLYRNYTSGLSVQEDIDKPKYNNVKISLVEQIFPKINPKVPKLALKGELYNKKGKLLLKVSYLIKTKEYGKYK